jgi:hypothetical protein
VKIAAPRPAIKDEEISMASRNLEVAFVLRSRETDRQRQLCVLCLPDRS